MNLLKKITLKLLFPRKYNLELNLKNQRNYPIDFSKPENKIIEQVKPYTMTSYERLFSLINAVRYIVTNNIFGSFVECGVWRGGSSMAIALTLLQQAKTDRDIYLFDTFEGMSEPREMDIDIHGRLAKEQFIRYKKNIDYADWCNASIEDVRKNLFDTGYPKDKIHFIKGKVEDTLPYSGLDIIALLRLDTDWYESTLHELNHLYPQIANAGICIIDDYGYWAGARKAVDEYFKGRENILLNRIDDTGRLIIKPYNHKN